MFVWIFVSRFHHQLLEMRKVIDLNTFWVFPPMLRKAIYHSSWRLLHFFLLGFLLLFLRSLFIFFNLFGSLHFFLFLCFCLKPLFLSFLLLLLLLCFLCLLLSFLFFKHLLLLLSLLLSFSFFQPLDFSFLFQPLLFSFFFLLLLLSLFLQFLLLGCFSLFLFLLILLKFGLLKLGF